ncbi:MAG TPA: zinc ABC transporter substrate-binding protein [Opitutaceae bacterium]|jgi:zinc/manganese transport system substrate-binding protein|nr:zinc ABC transporter substrate-binding protein [Opitutaceae bacterium]
MNALFRSLLACAMFCLAAGAVRIRADERPLRVAALHTILAEIAREVGGDKAQVEDIVKPGVDPHTFDPSPGDIRSIVDADLVFASGLHLESYLDRLVANTGAKGRVVMVGDALPFVLSFTADRVHDETDQARELLSADGEKDPHWWHSIDNVIFATDLVRAEYARSRPAWAAVFARNAQAYEQRLFALQIWVSHQIAKLPPARRQLVTSHDAFGYFARDYGFTIHSIGGLSTDGEPNAQHLSQLIDLIRGEHIRAVFAEDSVNPRIVQNLVSETGVHLGGILYADGLGTSDSDAASYESMFRHNVRTIVESLATP